MTTSDLSCLVLTCLLLLTSASLKVLPQLIQSVAVLMVLVDKISLCCTVTFKKVQIGIQECHVSQFE